MGENLRGLKDIALNNSCVQVGLRLYGKERAMQRKFIKSESF
jgi:hypothetical protein